MKKKENAFFKAQIFLLGFFFLISASTEAQKSPLKLKVVTEQANIRLKPDIGSIIIQQVPQGTIFESSGKEGEWYRIKMKTAEAEDVSGYVHESLVLLITPPPAKEKRKEAEEKEKKEQTLETQTPLIFHPPYQPAEYAFDLFLYGGGSFISGGDLNKGAQGFADFYSHSLAIEGKGKVKPARLSYIYGGELSFPLSPYFSLGLGVDYFLGERESRVEFEKTSSTDIYITRPKFQALPLRLSLSFYPLPYFYFKWGFEYYFAQCSYFYQYKTEEFQEEWQGEAKAQDIGFLGGFGFEWKLFSPLSFVIEATGRYARIMGLKGEGKYKDPEGTVYTEEGSLMIYEKIRIIGEKGYPHLFIHEKAPTAYVSPDPKPKEAILDFSGFSLKVGIKIRF